MSRYEALKSLQDKIKLEKSLHKTFNEISAMIATDFVNDTLILGNYDERIEDALTDHYELVGGTFSKKMGDRLPEDQKPDDSELAEIAAALALYYMVRAPKQRRHIQATTAKNVAEADKFAIDYRVSQAQDGIHTTRREERVVAGNKLNQHLKNRGITIATQETQTIAETAKHAEVSILAGGQPDFAVSNRNNLGVKKTWWTQGDEKVRRYGQNEFDHVTADLQEVDTNSPFTVSGESMMYPSDDGLGASLGNIINCRCGSEYSDNDIIGIRKR
ncbi:MAG: hypothetical protein OEM38_00435 [Gammaproteobacteria bacterium]|nr:hypothetical protein [Gammaproteobacteria bacterium]